MADGPWTAYQRAAQPQTAPAGPWAQYQKPATQPPAAQAAAPAPAPQGDAGDRYAGWDTPDAPVAPAIQREVPLQDDPNKTYGSVLPFARNNKTGKLEWAVPEMLRSAVRGVVEGGQEARGQRPVNDPSARSDITSAVSTFGGARAGVGEPRPGPVVNDSPVKPMALEARQAGYVLPPKSISETPGTVANVLAGWSGKIKTQQAASAKNQEVTNGLAQDALGVPRDTPLMPEVFERVRAQAGQAYADVVNAVPTIQSDQEFQQAVAGLGSRTSHAAQAFPNLMRNEGIEQLAQELGQAGAHPTSAWIELVKELRYQGNANLKTPGAPSAHALGLAQREAANHIDDLLEREISNSGQPGVVDMYRRARTLIAQAYDIEGATNPATGDVNARGLAKLVSKGKPLSGPLRTIANAALAFPKAMQPPSSFGDNEPLSALDFFAAGGAALHGNASIAAAILGRPAARAAVLSGPMQNRMAGIGASTAPPMQILPLPYQQQNGPAAGATNGIP